MKRSNRLILLIGLFLAAVAFILIVVFLGGSGGGDGGDTGPREVDQVYAKTDIPLGTLVTAANSTTLFETKQVRTPEAAPGVLTTISLTIGQTVRQDIVTGQPITSDVFGGGTDIKVPPGFLGVAIQVDQTTGAGTLIKAGDYVDVVVGFVGEVFPVIQIDPETELVTPIPGLNGTSVKLLIQQLQVIGTLLPPPPTDAQGEPVEGEPTLTGQQEIVIVAVTAQQAEIIKFGQMQGNISLALRSIEDFQGDIKPLPAITTGIILKTLVDEYGVLPPELIETTVGQ
ncbi:MAG TPA: Flp pilus assembly protein CpaB [Candidatus Limnocylindrales bacterium]|nr:Flp pilus assembly protein CpaB [Candidatus Limnocylindrales bacterium]